MNNMNKNNFWMVTGVVLLALGLGFVAYQGFLYLTAGDNTGGALLATVKIVAGFAVVLAGLFLTMMARESRS